MHGKTPKMVENMGVIGRRFNGEHHLYVSQRGCPLFREELLVVVGDFSKSFDELLYKALFRLYVSW